MRLVQADRPRCDRNCKPHPHHNKAVGFQIKPERLPGQIGAPHEDVGIADKTVEIITLPPFHNPAYLRAILNRWINSKSPAADWLHIGTDDRNWNLWLAND